MDDPIGHETGLEAAILHVTGGRTGSLADASGYDGSGRTKTDKQRPLRRLTLSVSAHGPRSASSGFGPESRLSLRESGATFAERKATLAAREPLRSRFHVAAADLSRCVL